MEKTHRTLCVDECSGREHALGSLVLVFLAARPDSASAATGEDVRGGEKVGVMLASGTLLHRRERAFVNVRVNGHDPDRLGRGEQCERAVVHDRVRERDWLVRAREAVVDGRRGRSGRRGRCGPSRPLDDGRRC